MDTNRKNLKKIVALACFMATTFSSFSYAVCATTYSKIGEDIRDHGATADDTTDDTDAIKCAVDAATTHSKKVVIPAGIYVINQTIPLYNTTAGSPPTAAYTSVQIVGQGWSSVIHHKGGNYAFTVGDATGNPQGVIFKDFWIKQEGSNPEAYGAIYYNGAHRALVDHMYISGYASTTTGESGEGGAAIKYKNTWIHNIRDSQIYGSHNGIYARGGSNAQVNALNVDSNDFELVKYGVVLQDNLVVNVRNNTIEGNTLIAAVYCYMACRNINVIGNYVEAGSALSQFVFIGNWWTNANINIKENNVNLPNTNSYVQVQYSRGVEISGNTFAKKPNTGQAYIKLGDLNTVNYFNINNNSAGAISGPNLSSEDWAGTPPQYVKFINIATGAAGAAGYGTRYDNETKKFIVTQNP